MAILKTTYGSTGSISYEQAESVLHLGGRTIRIYGDSDGGIHERELSPGDRVEIIDGNAVIHAEDCPDVAIDEGGITVKNESGKVVMKLGTGLGNMEWQQVAQQGTYEAIAPKEQKQAGANIDRHLQRLYHELFALNHSLEREDHRSWAVSCNKREAIKVKTKEISDYLGDC